MKKSPLRRAGIVLAASVLTGACATAGSIPDPGGSSPPTSVFTSSTAVGDVGSTVPDTTVAPEPLPNNPEAYAAGAFEAWTEGDEDLLARLMTDGARRTLEEGSLDASADWDFERCEGAAGSTYCTWSGPDGTLSFRVANQAASSGEEHAIAETLVAGG